ncbi:MAG: GtrA family protein [Acetobacteraceae bacterium]|nr:GtrA family protein [Acetobacteraceae bacterium]
MPMTAFLLQLSTWLPGPLRARATEARIRLLIQFGMFGLVGLVGFVIDTATVYALRHAAGLYVAGLAAYFTAATGTWVFNRLWTFRGQTSSDSWLVQWARFLTANLGGFVINRGLYSLLVTFVDAAAREPVIAVFVGAVAGMTLNFNLSRKMVFR